MNRHRDQFCRRLNRDDTALVLERLELRGLASRASAVAEVVEYLRQRPACGSLAKYENALADEIERIFGVT